MRIKTLLVTRVIELHCWLFSQSYCRSAECMMPWGGCTIVAFGKVIIHTTFHQNTPCSLKLFHAGLIFRSEFLTPFLTPFLRRYWTTHPPFNRVCFRFLNQRVRTHPSRLLRVHRPSHTSHGSTVRCAVLLRSHSRD